MQALLCALTESEDGEAEGPAVAEVRPNREAGVDAFEVVDRRDEGGLEAADVHDGERLGARAATAGVPCASEDVGRVVDPQEANLEVLEEIGTPV